MTAIAIHATPNLQFNPLRLRTKALAALVAVLMSFAAVATPIADTIIEATPAPVGAAVSYVMPDFVEDFVGTSQADAWGWRAVASAFTSVVVGATVGGTCAAGVIGLTGGIGSFAIGGCIAVGTGAGSAAGSLWWR